MGSQVETSKKVEEEEELKWLLLTVVPFLWRVNPLCHSIAY